MPVAGAFEIRLVTSSANRKSQSGTGIRINPAHRGHYGLIMTGKRLVVAPPPFEPIEGGSFALVREP